MDRYSRSKPLPSHKNKYTFVGLSEGNPRPRYVPTVDLQGYDSTRPLVIGAAKTNLASDTMDPSAVFGNRAEDIQEWQVERHPPASPWWKSKNV